MSASHRNEGCELRQRVGWPGFFWTPQPRVDVPRLRSPRRSSARWGMTSRRTRLLRGFCSHDTTGVVRVPWSESMNQFTSWPPSGVPPVAGPDPPPRKQVTHEDHGEPHFLTRSCDRRLPLLSKDRTRQWFVEALDPARAVHGRPVAEFARTQLQAHE